MGTLIQDVRYATRTLVRNPGFTVLTVLTLALGIGATAAVFTLVDGVLLRALPIEDPDRVVMVWETRPDGQRTVASAANYVDWRDRSPVFAELAIQAYWRPTLLGIEEPTPLAGGEISTNLLSLLGLEPTIGRNFLAAEAQQGADRVVLLSDELWRTRFGSDEAIVGASVRLDDGEYTVVGVLPSEFTRAGISRRIFKPITLESGDWLEYRGRHNVLVFGRLAAGVDLAAADAGMQRLAAVMAEEYAETNAGYGVRLEALKTVVIGDVDRTLLLLFGAVGFVLMIGCVNVANLQLVRSSARRTEIAVFQALGASRARVLRKLMIESSLLAGAGTAVGLLTTVVLMDVLRAFVPGSVPRQYEVEVGITVVMFTAIVGLLCALLVGVVPALRATRAEPAAGFVGRGATSGKAAKRLRGALVAVEFALAMILLVGAGLFVRTLGALGAVDLGLDPSNVLTARIDVPAASYPDPEAIANLYQRVVERVEVLPGVQAAAVASHMPLSRQQMNSSFSIEGGADSGPQGPSASYRIASRGYFATLGIPVISGRGFDDRDRPETSPVVVINETVARIYWPGASPIGARISVRDDAEERPIWAEIVGVVGDVRHLGPASPPVAEIYQLTGQAGEALYWVGASLVVAARVDAGLADAVALVRQAIRDVDPALPVYEVATLESFARRTMAESRFLATLLTMFSGAAMLLAAIGVYGVLSFHVRQRTREIGVCLALGAQGRHVVRSVVASGLKPALIGAVAGSLGAVVLTRTVEQMLFGVTAVDPVTFAAVPILLLLTTLVACYVPARRAARLDPVVALRDA